MCSAFSIDNSIKKNPLRKSHLKPVFYFIRVAALFRKHSRFAIQYGWSGKLWSDKFTRIYSCLNRFDSYKRFQLWLYIFIISCIKGIIIACKGKLLGHLQWDKISDAAGVIIVIKSTQKHKISSWNNEFLVLCVHHPCHKRTARLGYKINMKNVMTFLMFYTICLFNFRT